jgi:hypothetical protein
MAADNPLSALHQLTVGAFDDERDLHARNSLHAMADVCGECLDANLNHPHITYLREKKKGDA